MINFQVISFVLIMIGLLVITFGWFFGMDRIGKIVKQFIKDQQTIMQFLLKMYQDQSKVKDVLPANGNGSHAEVLKQVGEYLESESRGGNLFMAFPAIVNSLKSGVLPGAAAPDPAAVVQAPDPENKKPAMTQAQKDARMANLQKAREAQKKGSTDKGQGG